MTNDDPRTKPPGTSTASERAAENPKDSASGNGRRDPVFTDFDEDYEESDRDTDYASAYEDEGSDDDDYLEGLEDLEELLDEDNPDSDTGDWQVLGAAQAAGHSARETGTNPWEVKSADDDDDTAEGNSQPERELFDDEDPDDEDLEDDDNAADDEDWDETEEYEDDIEEDTAEPGNRAQHWPWGLVVVGILALVLLAAGGYGVIQQRSAAQEEIRQLQATLATAGNPDELAASRDALRKMEAQITRSQARVDELTLENKRLSDTVTGLEQQLAAKLPAAPQPAKAPATKAAPVAAVAAAPRAAATPATTAATGGGNWFVNFSSYGQRSIAESWVKKLKPAAGKAIVAQASKDGRTFYRVRIVGLTDRAQAEKVSGQLQSAYGLPPLWVGKE